MRAHILFLSICGGLILATASIGAHSDVGASIVIDRTHKGDRLPLTEVNVTRPRAMDQRGAGAYDLPDGCDALVSPLTHSQLARIAGRCVS
jgi:hypothetical protein